MSPLSGFDATNRNRAAQKRAGARTSLGAITPRDARLANRLERLRAQLGRLLAELEQLEGRV